MPDMTRHYIDLHVECRRCGATGKIGSLANENLADCPECKGKKYLAQKVLLRDIFAEFMEALHQPQED